MTEKDQKAMQVTEQEMVEREDMERTRDRQCFVPKTDIYETGEMIVLVTDIPGVDQESLDITLEKNVLAINAYNSSAENEDHAVAYSEYVPGDYHRKFRLTREVDPERIEAVVADGVLELRLPKAEEARIKKIPIKAG